MTRRDAKRDAVEDFRTPFDEGERKIPHLELPLDAGRANSRTTHHLGDGVKDVLEARVSSAAARDEPDDESERDERPDETLDRPEKGNEPLGLDLARDHEMPAVQEDDHDADC